ncbi:MAG: CapA family protein [Firmicutes bacterium]|nr:CapA family protein [Bacillota bacterium]
MAAIVTLGVGIGIVVARPVVGRDVGAVRNLRAARSARETVTIVAAGDVLLDRGVRKAIAGSGARASNGASDTGGGAGGRDGLRALLSGARQLFGGADIGLVNLECPATTVAAPAAKRFVFRAEPEWLHSLRETGITDLCLANNHALDQGPGGLGDTIDAALQAGLRVVGAGHTPAAARLPQIRRFDLGPGEPELTVALLAYNLFPQEGVVFDPQRPWVCFFDPETIRDEIETARRAAGVVVVSFHWGKEFSSVPGPAQVDLAHLACDWGANVVLGHHPHVVQGIEVYHPNGGPPGSTSLIAYSLGNFVFDQGGVRAGVIDVASTSETFVLKIEVGCLNVGGPATRRTDGAENESTGLLGAEVIPVVIDGCSPVAASGENATRIIQRIAALSRAFGTFVSADGCVWIP